MYSSRIVKDLKLLRESVEILHTEVDEAERYPTLYVTIKGPDDSLYAGSQFTICCILPPEYPMKSPSVAFKSKIWHPNIEQTSGAICLDVLGKKWSPVIYLRDVFELYIPQLLLHPEPEDPFNAEAARMMLADVAAYNDFVRDHCAKHMK